MSTSVDTKLDARDAAIVSLLPKARAIAARSARTIGASMERFEDLNAAAMAGAIKAVDTFDSTRDVPLEAFAEIVIRRAVKREMRRSLPSTQQDGEVPRVIPIRREPMLSLDDLANRDGLQLASHEPEPEDAVTTRARNDELHRALIALPRREREALEVRFFGKGGPNLMGVTSQRVGQLTQRALRRLRATLGPRLTDD
jgi:RNA polymerase sigma factor (sigma-70 family)